MFSCQCVLGQLPGLIVMEKAAADILVQVFWGTCFHFGNKYLGAGWLGHRAGMRLTV